MNNSMSRYTQSDINTILKCIEQNPSNISAAIQVASNLIGRTEAAVNNYYYSKLKHNHNIIAVASPTSVVLGKNTIRREIVPDATNVRDVMLNAAFSKLNKEQAVKFLIKNLSEQAKIDLLTRIVTRVNGR